jgi:hypothetical protein
MTVYSDMMEKRLEANRIGVDNLFKAQYLIGVLSDVAERVRKTGAKAHFTSSCLDIVGGHDAKDKKVPLKEINFVLDNLVYNNDRIEVDARNTESWIFVHLTDKNTGGSFQIDIGMERLECKRIEVGRKTVTREEIQYKYECE